jgi:Xyloglucan fucosyltransferase
MQKICAQSATGINGYMVKALNRLSFNRCRVFFKDMLLLLVLISLMNGSANEFCTAALGGYQRPAPFAGCGTWQEDYMSLHEQTLSGERPPRYLVSVAVEAGLADRVIGIISEFYFALLTGRAFQISSAHQKLPTFEAAFDAPHVNWTRPTDAEVLIDHLRYTYKGIRGYTVSIVVSSRCLQL